MAYCHVRSSTGQTALSVVAVALGVALVVAVRIMNAAVLDSFLDTVEATAGRAALTVSADEGVTFVEEIAETVRAVPGVTLAAPLVSSVAFPDDGSGESLTVHGVDLTHEAAVRLYRTADDRGTLIEDLPFFLNRPDSLLLGREFASRRGLREGTLIDLVTPTGIQRFTVRGLLESTGLVQALGGRLAVMDLYAAERAFAADGLINRIDLLLRDGADIEATKAAVAAVLPAGLRVEEPAFRKDLVRKALAGFQTMLTAFALLAVVGGFIICYGCLATTFAARAWEAGLLRAVGLRRAAVAWEFLKESLLLGAAGAALGIPLGVLISRVGAPLVARATALNFRLATATTDPSYPPAALGLGIVVGLAAVFTAALMPTLQVAGVPPATALAQRGREIVVAKTPRRWAHRVILTAAIVGTIVAQRLSGVVALGHVTTALIVLAACTLAAPMVSLGCRVLAPVWRLAFGLPAVFAVAELKRRARYSARTVATLGVGLGTVLLFGILGWSFERTLATKLTGRFTADLIVSSALVQGGYRAAAIGDALLGELAAIPGVATAVGNQAREVGYEGGNVVIDAFDALCFTNQHICNWPLDPEALPDALQAVARGDAIMVSSAFAYHHGTRPGDLLTLPSPNGVLTVPVAAVTSGQVENAIVMLRALYARAWNDSTIFMVHTSLEPGADRDAVAAAISRRLGAKYRLQVRSSAEVVDYFGDQVRKAFSVLDLLQAIVLVLVVVTLGDTLAASVHARTRQTGMMRAVGLRRSRIFGLVMLEGVTLGLVGLALALVVGLALGGFWVAIQFPALLGWKLDLYFPAGFAMMAAVTTLLLCLAGSLIPAHRASRLSVPEALRND